MERPITRPRRRLAMRPITAALVLVIGALLGVIVSSASVRAQAFPTFELGEHDKLLAEANGCYADCKRVGSKRVCTVKDFDCKAICQVIPECKPDGMHMMQVCAVMKGVR
jgi:hypothetical protein